MLPFIFEGEIKFYRKEKLKELQLHKKCRDFSKWKRKGCNRKYKNYERKNLICKGKYIAKVVDQPLIKLEGMLKGKRIKIIYIHN